jgi:FlaG/FlaF family flagellin (archaellin)
MDLNMVIISFTLTLLVTFTSCNNLDTLAIQNCYGQKIDVQIEFELDSKDYTILPKIKEKLNGNTLNLQMDYPSKIDIIETKYSTLKKGMPLKYLKITRLGKDEVINENQNIENYMDLDIIGEIACCPYILCI